jgi:hypothetical protein
MPANNNGGLFRQIVDLIDDHGADAGLGVCNVGIAVVSLWKVATGLTPVWLVTLVALFSLGLAFYGLGVWSKWKKRRAADIALVEGTFATLP